MLDGGRDARRFPTGFARRRSTTLALAAALATACLDGPAVAQTPQQSARMAAHARFDPEAFARDFRHERATVNGVRLHYVIGGRGDPVVLIHGWPQFWYAWRRVAPRLAAAGHTVIMVDMRGFGASDKPIGGYDTRTMAEDVRQLVRSLGYERVHLGAHDIGVAVAYAYASAHPDEVRRLAVVEMAVPGYGTEEIEQRVWHFAFNAAPDFPEQVFAGREREYVNYFYRRDSYDPSAIRAEDVDEYGRVYGGPGALRASLGFYRALRESEQQNRATVGDGRLLPMPVLAVGGEHSLTDLPFRSFGRVARDVRGVILPGAAHYVPEEKPVELARLWADFFADRPLEPAIREAGARDLGRRR